MARKIRATSILAAAIILVQATQAVYIPCRIVKSYTVYSLDGLNRNTFTTQLNNTVPISATEAMADKLLSKRPKEDKMLKNLLSNTGIEKVDDKEIPILSPDTIVTFRACSPLAESNVPNPEIC